MLTYKTFSFLTIFSLFITMNASQESAQKKRKTNHDAHVFVKESTLLLLPQEDLILKQKMLGKQFASTEISGKQLTDLLAEQADMKHCIQEFLFNEDVLNEELEQVNEAIENSNFLNFTKSLTMIQLYDSLYLQRNKSIKSYVNLEGSTLLHIAAMPTSKKFYDQTMQNQHLARQDSIIKLIIANGGDIDKKNREGETPMHFAALDANFSIIKKLHTHNNVMNVQSNDGETPMHVLIRRIVKKGNAHTESFNIIERLVFLGANLNIKNNRGHTPRHATYFNTPLDNLLKRLGAK